MPRPASGGGETAPAAVGDALAVPAARVPEDKDSRPSGAVRGVLPAGDGTARFSIA